MRYIGSSSAQGLRMWRQEFAKINFPAAFARIEADAAAVKSSNRSEASKEVELDTLRVQWKTLKSQQRTAEGR